MNDDREISETDVGSNTSKPAFSKAKLARRSLYSAADPVLPITSAT
jgi:hypothetical protein